MLLESVQERGVKFFDGFKVNYQDAAEQLVHEAATAVGADGDFAEFLKADFLITLVEHVVEILLDVIQIKENAELATFHVKNNVINKTVD